jgi:MYXO-CTERM domain-containing protein
MARLGPLLGALGAVAALLAAPSASRAQAPIVTLEAPASVAEGAEVIVDLEVEDLEGDAFTHSWDLDGDGRFGEQEGVFSHTVPAGTTDGDDTLRVGVRATDEHGSSVERYITVTITNVAPTITSEPPTFASVGEPLIHRLEVDDPAGALDPIEASVVRGPAGVSVDEEGLVTLVTWTPTAADVTPEDEPARIEVLVSDGDGGLDTQRWEVVVSRNRRPAAPVPGYPTGEVAILQTQPRLAAENAEDPDLDPLTYEFQIDTSETFDSPALQASGPIAETPGFTAWTPPEALAEDRLYHWRVRASDGTAPSDWRGAAFWVVRDPSLPPADGGAAADGGGPRRADGGLIPGLDGGSGGGDAGCHVHAAGAPTDGAAPLALLALLGGSVLRRRSR